MNIKLSMNLVGLRCCAAHLSGRRSSAALPGTGRARRAFSLLELIGVLLVIAILSAVLAPAFIRQMDRIAGEQESAALRFFGDALQQSIMRKRYVPNVTDWATNIAAELGVDVANVVTNQARRQPRFFLIDPALQIGTNVAGQTYTQTSAGATNRPVSPRVLVLSSIGRSLPASIASGVASSNDFNAVWDWNDGGSALPGTSFAWTGWPNGDDLQFQRVNLSPLFVRLILTTHVSQSVNYRIDSGSTNRVTSTSPGLGVDSYFIRNSLLYLYQGLTNIDSQQILTRDNSFVYEQNVWRSSLTGGSFLAGSLDVGSIVDRYLEAPENTNAMYTLTNNAHGNTNVSITQQSVVVSNMMAYMSAYTNWANSNFSDSAKKDTAINIQSNLLVTVQGQYQSGGGSGDYLPYPTSCPP